MFDQYLAHLTSINDQTQSTASAAHQFATEDLAGRTLQYYRHLSFRSRYFISTMSSKTSTYEGSGSESDNADSDSTVISTSNMQL